MARRTHQQRHLTALGIQQWQLRQPLDDAEPANLEVAIASAKAEAIDSTPSRPSLIAKLDWQDLQQSVTGCMACDLCQQRTHTVFGGGNPHAKLLFIGEGPGATEDKMGQPFVGRAGQLLDKMLQAIGLQRQDIFITNIVKCRPPNNRDPQVAEVASCTPYLNRQIELIKPQLMIALGRVAAHYLLQTQASLTSLRGQLKTYTATSTPVLVTYHPAYLLRNPRDKAKAFIDLQQIHNYLEQAAQH